MCKKKPFLFPPRKDCKCGPSRWVQGLWACDEAPKACSGLRSKFLLISPCETGTQRLVFQSPWEFSAVVEPQPMSCHPAPRNSPQSKASGPGHFTERARLLRYDTFPQIAPAPIIFLFLACHLWPCSREISLHGEGGIRSRKLLTGMKHTCILAPSSHLPPST